MTTRALGTVAAVLLTAGLGVACAIGTLLPEAVTPFWPLMVMVALLQTASAVVELRRERQISEVLHGGPLERTPPRLAYEAVVVMLVAAGLGTVAALVWRATSDCLAELARDAPIGACGTLITVPFGLPALAVAAAACLAAVRVAWGIVIAVAATPVTGEAVTFYRSASHTGDQDPAVLAVAGIAAAVALVSWVATSPRVPPLLRLTAVVALLGSIPVGTLLTG